MNQQRMRLKTEMRRSDKAILDADHVDSLLKEALIGVLSLCKNDIPYSIPVNFYYENGTIYIHCAKEGQKVACIKANPRACFLVVQPVTVPETECHGAMNYESVLCFGKATFSETSTYEVLSKLGKKYGVCSEITEENMKKTAMIQIEIDEVSAKRGYAL